MHVALLPPAELPGLHAIGAVARVGQKLPAGHALHDACWWLFWYVPATQSVHAPLPAAAALPAWHAVGVAVWTPHAWPDGHCTQSAALCSDAAAP